MHFAEQAGILPRLDNVGPNQIGHRAFTLRETAVAVPDDSNGQGRPDEDAKTQVVFYVVIAIKITVQTSIVKLTPTQKIGDSRGLPIAGLHIVNQRSMLIHVLSQ